MPPWLPHVLTLAGVAIMAGGSFLGTVIVTRRQDKVRRQEAAAKDVEAAASATSAVAAVQGAVNDGFHEMLEAWRGERGMLQAQVSAQAQSIEGLKGEIRGLIQHIQSLEKCLRDVGHKIPNRPRRTVRPALKVVQ